MVTDDRRMDHKSTPNKLCGVTWMVITMMAGFLDAWTAITRRDVRSSPTNTVLSYISWLGELDSWLRSFEFEQTNLERRMRCIKRISRIIDA